MRWDLRELLPHVVYWVHTLLRDGDFLLKGNELPPSKLNVLIVGLNTCHHVSLARFHSRNTKYLVHDDISLSAEKRAVMAIITDLKGSRFHWRSSPRSTHAMVSPRQAFKIAHVAVKDLPKSLKFTTWTMEEQRG